MTKKYTRYLLLDRNTIEANIFNTNFQNSTKFVKDKCNREYLCAFCRKFRRGDEIVFATTSTPAKNNGEYSSIGQYCF